MNTTSTTTELDPALPGLSVLMDDTRLRTWLAERTQTLVSRGPLRYKPGTTAVAALRLKSGPAFLYAAAESARPKLDKTVERAPGGTLLSVDDQTGLLLAGIAADRDLPAVHDLVGSVARVLGVSDDQIDLTLLVHNPQRRIVARVVGPDGLVVVVRGYRRSRVQDAVRRHRVASAQPVGTAEIVGLDTRRALVAVAHLSGRTLDRVAPDLSGDLWRQVGVTLATLHDAPAAGVVSDVLADRADPADTVALLSHLLPATARRWAQVLRRIEQSRRPVERVFCHGDFSADQVVRSDSGDLSFIDWDRAGWAPAAVDLAGLPAAGLSEVSFADVLEGYGEVRAVPANLRLHVAEARLLRAAGPFRTASVTWASDVETELATIEGLLL